MLKIDISFPQSDMAVAMTGSKKYSWRRECCSAVWEIMKLMPSTSLSHRIQYNIFRFYLNTFIILWVIFSGLFSITCHSTAMDVRLCNPTYNLSFCFSSYILLAFLSFWLSVCFYLCFFVSFLSFAITLSSFRLYRSLKLQCTEMYKSTGIHIYKNEGIEIFE